MLWRSRALLGWRSSTRAPPILFLAVAAAAAEKENSKNAKFTANWSIQSSVCSGRGNNCNNNSAQLTSIFFSAQQHTTAAESLKSTAASTAYTTQ